MQQKLPVNKFEWTEETTQFNEDLIKNYNEESGERHFLQGDVQYPEQLHELHKDLPFLPKRKKIKKVGKLFDDLYDKNEYIIHIRNLKQDQIMN